MEWDYLIGLSMDQDYLLGLTMEWDYLIGLSMDQDYAQLTLLLQYGQTLLCQTWISSITQSPNRVRLLQLTSFLLLIRITFYSTTPGLYNDLKCPGKMNFRTPVLVVQTDLSREIINSLIIPYIIQLHIINITVPGVSYNQLIFSTFWCRFYLEV